MNKNRFKELLRSTMGDVRPLVSEQGETPPFIPQTPRTSSPNSEGPDTLPNNVVTSPTPPEQPNDGKKELIDNLITSLKSMENRDKYDALMVSQIIYNNCAQWMNKNAFFSSRPGEPTKTKAEFAPEE